MPQAFEFLRLGRVARPHGFDSPFQHTRLMAQIAQLRMQRLDLSLRPLAVASRALLGTVQFTLQTRIRSTFALDLEQRALFRGLQTRLGQLRADSLFVEFRREIGTGLRQGGIALAQCLMRTCQLAFEPVTCCRGRSLRLLKFLDTYLRGQKGGRALLERRFRTRQIRLHCGD
ncbi:MULTISPECIES: hypothetical protein [Burkholderia]|uniref:Uncharacterized protein n=1 Tax=Burkholderia paludis TaxID=1506587 RepID=A0A6P2RZS9_9BURK|nr:MULTISPECIES: hypothetical protein [Burkholderia]CAB3772232.1 hypothetical protein LMG30113_06641 [Burkholderia paludis]VWC42659.1 hypothetical protein BPA30113_07040 [Burkholderia paludis]